MSNCGLGVGRNLFRQVGLSFPSCNLVILRLEYCQTSVISVQDWCRRMSCFSLISPEYGKLSRVHSRRINITNSCLCCIKIRCSPLSMSLQPFFFNIRYIQSDQTALNLRQPLDIMHIFTLFFPALASFLLPIAAGPLAIQPRASQDPPSNVRSLARPSSSANPLIATHLYRRQFSSRL